jgi:hypothetical protein
VNAGDEHQWWYVGTVFLLQRLHKTRATPFLIANGIRLWESHTNISIDGVNFCAIGASKEGRDLAEKLAFTVVANQDSTAPIYSKTSNRSKITARMNELDKLAGGLMANGFQARTVGSIALIMLIVASIFIVNTEAWTIAAAVLLLGIASSLLFK